MRSIKIKIDSTKETEEQRAERVRNSRKMYSQRFRSTKDYNRKREREKLKAYDGE